MKIKLLCLMTFIGIGTYAQTGIGTITPDASAVLEINSTDKGFLPPRMTEAQMEAIVDPVEGLVVYCTDCIPKSVYVFDGVDFISTITGIFSTAISTDCTLNNFEGTYVNGVVLTPSNKFLVTISNISINPTTKSFSTSDLVLSGVSGITVSAVSPTSATIASGDTQVVEYSLAGTPSSSGSLTGIWTKEAFSCTKTINVINGDATFTLPQTAITISTSDGSPLVELQGIVDNASNQLTINIPYTGGVGTYDAYTGVYTPNNAGTAEGGDTNSFRLTYPAGSFSASGSITATIEVDGDGSFNAKKQLFGVQETIAALDFQVNGNSMGHVNLDVIGGILDRNFADANHKFIYLPVTAADGNTWLNNNLGANYANMNHAQFNPTQQATAYNDHHAYGSLFQWGRYSDGHELIDFTDGVTGTGVNGTTSTLSTSDTPGNNLFITNGAFPFKWRDTHNDNLWQGEAGINNPCPQGYRLPTDSEIDTLVTAESISDHVSGASSSLGFSVSGYRNSSNGTILNAGINGYYWTSSVASDYVRSFRLFSDSILTGNSGRVFGLGVRCIKD